MTVKKRALGRGLEALLGGMQPRADAPEAVSGQEQGVSELPLDLIERGRFQPRRDFNPESLQELADSIAAQGVVQPVVVRPVDGGRYELIAGERRWRASQQAGLSHIPAVVREVTDQAAMAIGLIENIQREDLNPLEQAVGLNRLLHEFELTHQEIAQAVGKSRVTVTNLLRLLDLQEEVKDLLQERRLEMGHARALLGLKGAAQAEAARQVVNQGLSVRETERLVRRLLGVEEGVRKPEPRAENPDVLRLGVDLSERLGARVEIKQGRGGKGSLVIAYNSLDELDGILAHIQ